MKTLHHKTPSSLPHYADGVLNIQELLKILCEATLNAVMDAQADALCEELGTVRNGYRERGLTTCVGSITLRIPKLRSGTYFPDSIIERYSRQDRALVAAVAEMYAQGISTRKVERVALELGVDRMSKSQVSRICAELDEEVGELLGESLSDLRFPYLWLDATYLKVRDAGRVKNEALVTAIALREDGIRRVVGASVVDAESEASWREFLLSLRNRGMEGVVCVTSDAHKGLVAAIERVFPGACWQRCIVHLERDLKALATTRAQKDQVVDIASCIFRGVDAKDTLARYHAAIDSLSSICPKAAELLENAEADALTHLAFPKEHRRRLRTNNVQERLNREIKRRSRVVQVFPSKDSLMRLIGSVLVDQNEAWAKRHWFKESSVLSAYESQPEPILGEDEKQEAQKAMILALQGIIIPQKKAA